MFKLRANLNSTRQGSDNTIPLQLLPSQLVACLHICARASDAVRPASNNSLGLGTFTTDLQRNTHWQNAQSGQNCQVGNCQRLDIPMEKQSTKEGCTFTFYDDEVLDL